VSGYRHSRSVASTTSITTSLHAASSSRVAGLADMEKFYVDFLYALAGMK
jgi:hypothetical protein